MSDFDRERMVEEQDRHKGTGVRFLAGIVRMVIIFYIGFYLDERLSVSRCSTVIPDTSI
jgi:hypothetical protein